MSAGTSFNRLHAYKKNGMLFLSGNMLVNAGSSSGGFVEIGTISGWNAVDSCYCTIAPQGNNGTAIMTVYVTSAGSIQLYCPNAVANSNTWYRFCICVPEA